MGNTSRQLTSCFQKAETFLDFKNLSDNAATLRKNIFADIATNTSTQIEKKLGSYLYQKL